MKFCQACFGFDVPHVCGVCEHEHVSSIQEARCALQEVCRATPTVDAPSWGLDCGEAELWETEEHDGEGEGPMSPW